MSVYRRFLHSVSLLAIACAAGGCQSPDSYKYKMSPYSPASSSLWDAYTDPLPAWWSDTKALFKSGVETHFTPMGPPKGPVAREKQQEANYNRYMPVYLKVYKVAVVEEYASPRRDPNVEHLLDVSPAEAVHSWSNRLRTSGGIYNMEVVIRDASVVSARVNDGSVENPNRRYDARLEVEMRIYNRSGKLEGSIATVASRSAMIREQTGVEERRAIFRRMLADLIDVANGDLEQKMFSRFSPFIDFSRTA